MTHIPETTSFVSPFTPLFFPSDKSDGKEGCYIQTFSVTDKILIQVIGGKETDTVCQVWNIHDDIHLFQINFQTWEINSDIVLRFASIMLPPGIYFVSFNGLRSAPFQITDNTGILDNTTLIQYSMNSNRHRKDVVFFIDGMQHFFDFRVPGGFKDCKWTFGIENEQFVTDESDIVQLYGLESTQKKFTLGNSEGCPVWFGEMLNRILCCTYVYFDGERYARKESSVPEMTILQEGLNSFVFDIQLQKVNHLDPMIETRNRLCFRRGGDALRSIDTCYRKI